MGPMEQKQLTNSSDCFDDCSSVRDIWMKFPDENVDDTDEEEDVDEDGDNAGHLVDPVVQAIL